LSSLGSSGFCDPLSLFSVFRRFYFLDTIELDRTDELYERVRSLRASPKDFAGACHLIATQTLEVTRKCEDILSPALSIAGPSRKKLEAFIRSERGHDRILTQARDNIGCEGEFHSEVIPIVELVLNLFKLAAQTDFLAFSFAVAIFEQGSHDGNDPFAELLRSGGLDQSAKQIQKHFDINETGVHDAIGIALLRESPPISFDQARYSASLCELISKTFNQMTAELLDQVGRISPL
jgi:hypothetical protein